MGKMENTAYQPVYLDESQMDAKRTPSPCMQAIPTHQNPGVDGKLLYKVGGGIRWYLLFIILYALAAIAFGAYILHLPSVSEGNKVLPWGVGNVNQFYSGLALSFLLTPAAVIIRQISKEYAQLHAFSAASAKPVRLSDLDKLMDPGFTAMLRLFAYLPFAGIIQALLTLAGVALVPVGTLTVYTGNYSEANSGAMVVGVPLIGDGSNAQMSLTVDIESEDWSFGGDDTFRNYSMYSFVGGIVDQAGVLQNIPSMLGPSETGNLTFQDQARASGLITYTWDAQCQTTEDIAFTEITTQGYWEFNITLPSGTTIKREDAYEGGFWMEVDNSTNTTYFALIGTDEETVNLEEAVSASAITDANGAWISRVACTPVFNWQVSECTWDAPSDAWVDCIDAPGFNTSELDIVGLNEISEHMTSVPAGANSMDTWIYGFRVLQTPLMYYANASNSHQYRAPLLSDYNNLYGMVARSLASVSTSGYYGAAIVPITGEQPRLAYIVRGPVLAVVMVILALPALLCTWSLAWERTRGNVPFRPATFLTVAAATRGPWWDAATYGDGVMPHEALITKHKDAEVMFGVDQSTGRVGFATTGVSPVVRGGQYA